jgi:hypothetical protein
MSAYDNPTIIKDESAMIYAQMLGTAGLAFTESFKAARKEREEKEKEAKEQTIRNQIYGSEERYKYQTRMAKIDDGLVKAGVSPDGTKLVNDYIISTGEINGINQVDIKTKVLSKEDLDKKNTYIAQVAQGEENLVRVSGALFSQAQAIKNGDINDTNIKNIKFNGDNILDQTLNKVTAYALAYPDNDKTTKKLDYDANGDPSQITLQVATKIGDYKTLKQTFKDTNPAVSDEEIEAKINEGFSKGFIIKDDNDQYSINFKKDINSDYNGELYTKIPEIDYGKAPVTAGVYGKENDTDVSPVYMKPTEYIDVEGNANLSKTQGIVKYQRTPIDIKAIRVALRPSLQAKAEGLIASFQDPDTTDAVLANLGFGTNYQSKEFAKYDLTTKVNLLVKKMEEKEVENIIKRSQLTLIDGEYYKMDPENVARFQEESKKTTKPKGGPTAKQIEKDKTRKQEDADILGVSSTTTAADYSRNNRRIMYQDGSWYVATSSGNKEQPIPSSKKALEYLNTGKF